MRDTQGIDLVVTELQQIATTLDTWDVDPSKVQRQIDAFVNSLHNARLLKKKKNKQVKLHDALKDLAIQIEGRDTLVCIAESLEDLINEYEDEINEEEAQLARKLADDLIVIIRKALGKATETEDAN